MIEGAVTMAEPWGGADGGAHIVACLFGSRRKIA